MDLFDLPLDALPSQALDVASESPLERAQRRVRAIIEARHPICIAFSAGKDSTALANVVLMTAAQMRAAGATIPPIIVVNSDTGVEQPEIVALSIAELAKMERFARDHGFDLRTMRGQPQLSDSFAVRIIGGRALPAFPDSRVDCSVSWKVDVNARLLARAVKEFGGQGWNSPVVMTGVRQDESHNCRTPRADKCDFSAPIRI